MHVVAAVDVVAVPGVAREGVAVLPHAAAVDEHGHGEAEVPRGDAVAFLRVELRTRRK
jgi:hypothetical protein